MIDGRRMGRDHGRPFKEGSRVGVRCKQDERMPFVFSDLVLRGNHCFYPSLVLDYTSLQHSDDDTLDIDVLALTQLGRIEVTVNRTIYLGHGDSTRYTIPNDIGPIHEKSKKAGGHCVS